jgi:putative ABC transport system substrate-binding protein
VQAIEGASRSLGIQATVAPVLTAADIETTLAGFAHAPNGGLILPTGTFTLSRFSLSADLAERYRLPSIAAQVGFAKEGGLMEYGASNEWIGEFRRAASYVDRMLRGAKPSNLPVQGRDKYTFVINLKTAKVLGLTIPERLLATADGVIQ